MKRFIIIGASVAGLLLSSCTVFVLNEAEHSRKNSGDTISITIAHDREDNRE